MVRGSYTSFLLAKSENRWPKVNVAKSVKCSKKCTKEQGAYYSKKSRTLS